MCGGQRTTCGTPPSMWIPGTELRSPSLGETAVISLAISKALEEDPESDWEPWTVSEVERQLPVLSILCLL